MGAASPPFLLHDTTGRKEWKPSQIAPQRQTCEPTSQTFFSTPLFRPLFSAKIMTPNSDDRTQTFRHRKINTGIEQTHGRLC